MCNHANHTEELINHLLENVYPAIDLSLQRALNGNFLEDMQLPENDVMMSILQDIQTDFNSLVTYEQKLVFPSVLKVFYAKKSTEPLPNLYDLLQLTKSKEHKLQHHIKKLIALLNSLELYRNSLNQQTLVRTFQENFMPEKLRWNNMIEDRLNSCNCFRKAVYTKAEFQLSSNPT